MKCLIEVNDLGDAKEGGRFFCLLGLRDNLQVGVIWNMIHLCIMWCIWDETNGHCFEDKECSMDDRRRFFL